MFRPTRAALPAFLILGCGLILSTLACQLQLGGPRPPAPPVEIPSDASTRLKQVWDTAVASAGPTGEVSFSIDEPLLNGLVRQQLAIGEDAPILQPQVYLRQGQIQVYGLSTQGLVQARVRLSIRPLVNSDGQLVFDIPSAEFGPLPAPEALKQAAPDSMNEVFNGTFGPLAAGIRVSSIVIDEGQMAIVAKIR